jgi:hypothetical protein
MDTSKNKEILDAEILSEDLNNENVETQGSSETKTLFKILLKDSNTENMSAVFDYVDAHSFNSEIIVGLIHLILNSYCSMVPEDERASFAIDVVQKFITSLRDEDSISEEASEEASEGVAADQEDDDFIPDQPEHDGN